MRAARAPSDDRQPRLAHCRDISAHPAFGAGAERQEGAAAVGTAALLTGKFVPTGPTVTILSGANIDPVLHARVMAGASEAA